MFRPLTLVAALCMALLIYLTLTALLVQRLNRMIHVTLGASPPSTPVIHVADGQVFVLGQAASLLAVIGTASIPPTWWVASVIYASKLRRTRERLGQCFKCGLSLSAKRGRCPRCGERFDRSVMAEPRAADPVAFQKRRPQVTGRNASRR